MAPITLLLPDSVLPSKSPAAGVSNESVPPPNCQDFSWHAVFTVPGSWSPFSKLPRPEGPRDVEGAQKYLQAGIPWHWPKFLFLGLVLHSILVLPLLCAFFLGFLSSPLVLSSTPPPSCHPSATALFPQLLKTTVQKPSPSISLG